jgi:ferredoxin-type protein NapH
MAIVEYSPYIVIPLYVALFALGIFLIHRFAKNKTRRVSTLRLFIQIGIIFALFMGLIIGPFNQPLFLPLGPSPRDNLVGANLLGNQFPDGISLPVLACYYPNGRTVTCPIWQLQAYVFPFWDLARGYQVVYSTSGLEKIGIVIGLVAIAALILGRFFCGWLCPLGLYQDLLTRLRKTLRVRHRQFSDSNSKKLSQSRYVIIAAFMILSVIFASYAIFGAELIPGTKPGGPEGTEAGIVSYVNEPFCLVCPARPLCIAVEAAVGQMNFSYIAQIAYGPFWISGFYLTSLNVIILIIVTILAIMYRRLWCRICPLGALTALFSSFTPFKQIALTKLVKNERKCTSCGICKRVCPTQATDVYDRKGGDVTESRCILCARCVELCPYDDALEIKFAGRTMMKSRDWLET